MQGAMTSEWGFAIFLHVESVEGEPGSSMLAFPGVTDLHEAINELGDLLGDEEFANCRVVTPTHWKALNEDEHFLFYDAQAGRITDQDLVDAYMRTPWCDEWPK